MNKAFEPVDRVVDELMGGRVVAYRALFAHCFGGATAGLLLSQFWYYSMLESAKSRDGWFDPSMDLIEDETGLTRTEQETARRKLRDAGVLEEARLGIPARLWFRLNKERAIEQLRHFIPEHVEKKAKRQEQKEVRQERRKSASLFAENPQTGPQETHKQGCGEPAPNQGQKPRAISNRFRKDSELDSEQDSEQQQTAPPPEPPSSRSVVDVIVGADVVGADVEVCEGKRSDTDHTSKEDLTKENELPKKDTDNIQNVESEAMTADLSSEELLLKELISEGMGEKQAKKAVAEKYDVAAAQLENLRRALPTEKLTPNERGKWLYMAIKDGYGPTKGYANYLEAQKAQEKRRQAHEKRDAAQRVRDEEERVPSEELELTADEKSALRQKARNCVHPDWRKRGEAKCAALIQANFDELVRGEERKEYSVWLVSEEVDVGEPASEGD